MRHLPVFQARPSANGFDLDGMEVQTPCEVPWEGMTGDNRVRHCGHCRQNVYNIEALPRAEAVRLVGAREGHVCVRFYRRRDGTVVTADCWARLRAARRKGVAAFVAMLVVVGVAQVFAMLTGLAGLKRVGVMGALPMRDLPAADVDVPPAPPDEDELVMGKVDRLFKNPPSVQPAVEGAASVPAPPYTVGRLRRK